LMDRYDGMDGIKTGYIRASGFNLVASAKHGNTRLIGVVFGGHSAVARDNHMAELLDASFPIAEADKRSGHIAVANGEGDGSDNANDDYVELPAKISAVFPAHGSVSSPVQVQTAPEQHPLQLQVDTPSYSQNAPAAPTPPLQQVASIVVPPAPASPPRGNWGIQIGAYSDPAIGQQALANLIASMQDMLTGGDPEVQKISTGSTVMYRARILALDKKTAQSVCSYLIQRGKSCLTVEP